jgi:hypothetical protein
MIGVVGFLKLVTLGNSTSFQAVAACRKGRFDLKGHSFSCAVQALFLSFRGVLTLRNLLFF